MAYLLEKEGRACSEGLRMSELKQEQMTTALPSFSLPLLHISSSVAYLIPLPFVIL